MALAFNNERYDTNAFHDNATNNSRFTIPTTGYYRVGGNINWASSSSGMKIAWLQVNNTTVIASDSRPTTPPGAGTYQTRQNLNTEYHFTVGDYVELFVYQDSGSSQDVQNAGNYSAEFWISKIG